MNGPMPFPEKGILGVGRKRQKKRGHTKTRCVRSLKKRRNMLLTFSIIWEKSSSNWAIYLSAFLKMMHDALMQE